MSETTTQPPEWARHAACWLAYPASQALWMDDLAAAQAEFIAFCQALGPEEPMRILVPDVAAQKALTGPLAGLGVLFHIVPYGDIWLRDTAPIFLRDAQGGKIAGCFQFNGWGKKFLYQDDIGLNKRIAAIARCATVDFDLVLEGGSVDTDGAGLILTSEQCLLNANRNPTRDRAQIEAALLDALGGKRVLWLTEGLQNDHTDGHIDTIARFIGPNTVACMMPADDADPNAAVLRRIRQELGACTNAGGKRLKVVEITSPGTVTGGPDKNLLPASYLNFYIGNRTVVVPTYGSPFDNRAVAQLAAAFPHHRTVGRSAKAILTGGGAFHCMSQQEPA